MFFSLLVATSQVSGRNSIMFSIGHPWVEPGMNAPKASEHLEEEEYRWIAKLVQYV